MNGSGKHPDATTDHNNRYFQTGGSFVRPQARQPTIDNPAPWEKMTVTLVGEEGLLRPPPLHFLLLTACI